MRCPIISHCDIKSIHDKCEQEEGLYIAMAGQHQIWRHDLKTGTTSAFSGDGYERNANGASGPATSWAQVFYYLDFLRCRVKGWGSHPKL